MGEYGDSYLSSDVSILTDIIENLRGLQTRDYGLDPVYYFTLLNFAWDAMLKITSALHRILDKIMYEMFEKGFRGGICQVVQKQIIANNKYVTI